MTLTVAPLMGQISASYAMKATPYSAFCSRFNFNLYSYESELVVGCELWQRRQSQSLRPGAIPQPSTFLTAVELTETEEEDPVTGVLKARMGSNFDLGIAWEGRFRNVAFSLGASLDLLKANGPVKNVGCEISYTA
jgi:distribution and morphology protein 10